jgi:cobalt-zinc-cadmium efflux system outer membrane protein
LNDEVTIARSQNPDLTAAAEELNVARGQFTQSSYLSQFNFQSDNEFAYRTRQNRSNSQDWRVSMLQELEVFGQRGMRMKSASQRVEQSSAEVRDQMRLLTATVKLTFFDAMRARQMVQLLAELERLDSRLLDAAGIRVDAGEINQIEFNLAKVRYGQSQRALILAQENYRLQRSSFGRLLGGYLGGEPEPAGDLSQPALTLDLETLAANARRNRPDLRARQLEVARLNTEYALNSRMNLPNPKVGVLFGHDQNTEHFGGPAIGFSIPLFNRRSGEAAVLQARRRQAEARVRQIDLDIEKQVRDAYHQYLAARTALQILESDVVTPAREGFNLLEQAFKEGKIDLLRLSVAEREVFQAQVSYFDAWFGVRSAEVALELATGSPA